MIIIPDYQNLNGSAVKISAHLTNVRKNLTMILTHPNVRPKLNLTLLNVRLKLTLTLIFNFFWLILIESGQWSSVLTGLEGLRSWALQKLVQFFLLKNICVKFKIKTYSCNFAIFSILYKNLFKHEKLKACRNTVNIFWNFIFEVALWNQYSWLCQNLGYRCKTVTMITRFLNQ